MKYYAWANRYRGSRSKGLGYLLLGAPSCAVYAATWFVVGMYSGFSYWQLLPAFIVLTYAKILLMFKWWHDSDAWRNADKMRKQWMWKGAVGFLLLGYPFGFLMHKISRSYVDNFTSEKEDKQQVEFDEGAMFGCHEAISTSLHCLVLVLWAVL